MCCARRPTKVVPLCRSGAVAALAVGNPTARRRNRR